MLKLFREVLKVGESTVLYPFVPAEVLEGFRGRPHHDPELCIACAACTIACPSECPYYGNRPRPGYPALVYFLWPLHLLRSMRRSLPDQALSNSARSSSWR